MGTLHKRRFGVNGLVGAVTSQLNTYLHDEMLEQAEKFLQFAPLIAIAQINAQELCSEGLDEWKYRKIRQVYDTRFDNEENQI